jgi:hypothetical protein
MELICLGFSFEEKRIVPALPVNVLPQSLQIHLCLPEKVFPFLLKLVLPQWGQQLKPVAYKVRLSKDLMQESITMHHPDDSGIRHEGNCYIVIMADS